MEDLKVQFCPKWTANAKDEFLVELSKLEFPVLKKLIFYESYEDKLMSKLRKLTDSTLQNLVSNCPNLKQIHFGDDFDDSNISFKTLMDLFEKRNIFIFYGQTRNQFSMEQWFLNQDRNVYENYQKLKPIYMS